MEAVSNKFSGEAVFLSLKILLEGERTQKQ